MSIVKDTNVLRNKGTTKTTTFINFEISEHANRYPALLRPVADDASVSRSEVVDPSRRELIQLAPPTYQTTGQRREVGETPTYRLSDPNLRYDGTTVVQTDGGLSIRVHHQRTRRQDKGETSEKPQRLAYRIQSLRYDGTVCKRR